MSPTFMMATPSQPTASSPPSAPPNATAAVSTNAGPIRSDPVTHFSTTSVTFDSRSADKTIVSISLVETDLGDSDDFWNIHLDLQLTPVDSNVPAKTVPLDHILTVRHFDDPDTPSLEFHLRSAVPLGTLTFTQNPSSCTSFLRVLARHARLPRLTDPALPHPLHAVDPFPRMRRAVPTLSPLSRSTPAASSDPSPSSHPSPSDVTDTTALLSDLKLDVTPPHTYPQPDPPRAFALNMLSHFALVTQAARDLGDRLGALLDEDRRRAREAVENALAAGPRALDAYATLVASASPAGVALPPALTAEGGPRGLPLSLAAWTAAQDDQHRLRDPTVIRYAIFAAGIEPELRPQVWPYLLGVFPWHSTRDERTRLLQSLRSEYAALKRRWRTVLAAAEARVAKEEALGENTSEKRPSPRDLPTEPHLRAIRVCEQIDKDVVRTDRTITLYEADDAPATRLMATLLNVYAAHDARTAYCQGMSDFLSPLLHVFANAGGNSDGTDVDEAMVFWCFEGLMRRMEANFRVDQSGMRAQLHRLREVLRVVDPDLAAAFADADPEYYACFRWMLVRFKRELSFEATQRFWEVLWTRMVAGDELHVFAAAGLLVAHRRRLLALRKGAFDSLLRYVNDMSMRIDVDFAIREGELCHHKFVEKGGKPPEE